MIKQEEKDIKAKVRNRSLRQFLLLIVVSAFMFVCVRSLMRISSDVGSSNTTVINVDEEFMRVTYSAAKPGIYKITNTAVHTDGKAEIKHNILKEIDSSYTWAFYLSYDNNWLLEIENIRSDPNSIITIAIRHKNIYKKIAFTEENYIGKSIIMNGGEPQVLTIN